MKRGMSGQKWYGTGCRDDWSLETFWSNCWEKKTRSAGHRVPPRSVGKSMATLHGAVRGSQWIQWRGPGGASKLTRFEGWKPNSYHRFGIDLDMQTWVSWTANEGWQHMFKVWPHHSPSPSAHIGRPLAPVQGWSFQSLKMLNSWAVETSILATWEWVNIQLDCEF